MHRSRLSTILIDCQDATMDAGVQFWSQALGMPARRATSPTEPYVPLEGEAGGLGLTLQRVYDASRIHLDIETDDVEAEVQRLEKLGAHRQARVDTWWVMQDPCGHIFCVVPQHSPAFHSQAQTWNNEAHSPS